ncbi:MAG: hypothetical protein IJ035_06285 [Oscillospiraceae bacterium]|nr:hypothetical protein [Oscillospiraceae bacterium]
MKNFEEWLTYDYMYEYMGTHGDVDTQIDNLIEYGNLIEETRNWDKKRAHNRVTEWFLEEYPEVRNFGRNERMF